jgi:hypothetical protein
MSELEAIVDHGDWNLTFASVTKMKEKAPQWLATTHPKRILSVTADEELLIDTARAIRDCIAHQSIASGKEMNLALKGIDANGAYPHLVRPKRTVGDIGAYLTVGPGGRIRLHRHADGLEAASTDL